MTPQNLALSTFQFVDLISLSELLQDACRCTWDHAVLYGTLLYLATTAPKLALRLEESMALKTKSEARRRIVFLDVDGVLHPLGPNHLPIGVPVEALLEREDGKNVAGWPSFHPHEFSPQNMRCLVALVREADSIEIVLTSTWREQESSLATVRSELGKHSLRVRDTTPIHAGGDVRGRGNEIAEWLAKQERECELKYVILDDAELTFEAEDRRSMAAHFVRVDKATGLTMEHVEAARRILDVQ